MNRPAARGLRPPDLRRALSRQPPGPLYFCLGEESYLTEQAIDLLRAAAVGDGDDLFNVERFEAGALMTSVLTAAATLPAFAQRRVVILTRADALTAGDQDRLAGYVEAPVPTTCLVIAAAKADQRRRLFSLLQQRATVINCQPLFERELPGWLMGQAAAMGLQLAPEAAHELLERTGTSLHALINELEKLRAHGVTIDLAALTALTSHGREHSVFELTDALGERRLADALALARRLLDHGEHPVGLTTMLIRHLRRLRLARCAADAGVPPAELARRLGVMPRYADTLSRQANGFTADQLTRALACCLTADAQLKGGRLPKEQVVDLLLLEVCGDWSGPLMAAPA
ncbi:MAG: DNA polymerase III subunit delta [Nitrospirota bacterium]